jgi:multicomponent Na+:H+ antiporter subunit D
MGELPPFVFFLVGAGLVAVTRGPLRAALLLATPIVSAVSLYGIADGSHFNVALFDYELQLLRVDKLSLLFGYLFHLAALIAVIYSLHLRDTVQHVTGLLYAGGALSAVFAGDLITLFLAWEALALSSVFLILARRTPCAQAAAMRYLAVQVISGLILLAGVLVRLNELGSAAFSFIGLDSPGGALIFVAFGIKCGFPLLHNWLTDAYPEATPTGAVFLSAFTTKVAVYALARGFPGTEILVYVGAVMTMFPIFYAVIENDLRRVLAYSMINQLGFMVVGIGLGTAMAINGAVSHAFNDVIFKSLLFMSMGAVLRQTGKINGSELGGLYKTMPFTTGVCIVGALSISAFPLFSGFVSKSMVMVAALDEGYPIVWLALLFASAGVFHHAGIKIPFFAFFGHDSGMRTRDPSFNMLLAMGLAALICIFNGAWPWLLYDLLPFPVTYEPYTATHVLAQCQLLFFSALAFAWLKLSGLYPPELVGVNIDADWIYRKPLKWIATMTMRVSSRAHAVVLDACALQLSRLGRLVFRYSGPQGVFARTLDSGQAALWVAILLAASLLLYYL